MNILLDQGWSEIDSKLVKNYELPNFIEAINFINLVAAEAENMDHHPDIKLYNYKNVRLILTTHSKGKITKKDIILAKSIDKVFDSMKVF
ncbi:4a-hydroxytetrahydrobiopterin dehydratase [Labilibaculum euxinus]|uniref:4a-hydroxytetrahydrobiopterin dehydratase n=1 Tax=Labilibaculum euxinus TaxID=2686357 RepID=A0A7M4D6H6_9BACT|nr:4a-hydroxytetrahydrobiopterin dehydratase [Labilibaculum euxinus]MUP38255.1 4a-hydroxytetrahydrobiopterin dehydratase [Labilibaculum euxinus]MVB07460.1 4a-hydroxytetrahydrobiopterin dehydratase [Labilibaculum euxinus]